MRRWLIYPGLVVLFVGLVFAGRNVLAQQGNEERITLSPAVARPELDAGEKANGTLTVINDGDVAYDFVLYSRPFSVNNEDYEPNYNEVSERTEAYQWVQFSETQFNLKPDQRVKVDYTVTVPEQAAPGGHYAVLFAETQPKNDTTDSVARKKRVGSLLYMTISGNVIEEGNLSGWDVKTLQTTAPVTSDVRITNGGNVHFQTDLSVRYENIFGKKQFEKNQELLVLPGTTRKISTNWDNPPYFGIYKASGEVRLLGRSENLNQKWIIVFPKSLMIIIATLVVAGLLWFVVRPKVKHHRNKKRHNDTNNNKHKL